MQIVDCNVAIGGDVRMVARKLNVTIAELVVLQAVHGRDAVTNVVVAGEVVGFSPTSERERLKATYELTEESVQIATLFPGVIPQMPTRLEEIVLVEPDPDEKARTVVPPQVRRFDGNNSGGDGDSLPGDDDLDDEDGDDKVDEGDDEDEPAPTDVPPGVDVPPAPAVDPFS